MPEGGRDWIYKALRLFTKGEVKTPLLFLFKLAAWVAVGAIAISYAPIGDQLKGTILEWFLVAMLTIGAATLAFAWFRPKHLVYGETGHRAEPKIDVEYGTSRRPISKEESESLPPASNPELPAVQQVPALPDKTIDTEE